MYLVQQRWKALRTMELQKGVKTMKAFIPKSNVRTAVKTELRNLALARVLHCIVCRVISHRENIGASE